MAPASSSDVKLEIGHVLFIDIVGYSKLLINEQSEHMQTLREIVRGTEQFRVAEAEGKLLRLPTGDGGALVFRTGLEAPVLCALEISKALENHPELRVRMGIHSGPVNEITDLNEQANIAGAGINIAQRVMDCGDAGHILLSKHVADDLEHYPRWKPYLRALGECEAKHGLRIGVVNLYRDEVGNPQVPKKFRDLQRRRSRMRWGILAAGIVLLAAVVAAFIVVSRTPAPSTSAVPEKSIAVLPFENLSSDRENAYFAEGIQDEILTRLSKIADLKVISRTSTQKYESAPGNLREVGQQLGVANLLEGSVQKAGNAVHINVQLIKVASDAHLWAESYDRELQNIFGVEAEVAGAIAQALKARLAGSEEKALALRPTDNVVAYEAYLRGRSIEETRHEYAGFQQAAANYATAVQLDPKFAAAWAHLAVIRGFLYFNGVDLANNSAAAIKEAADHAFALQPELGEAWIAQGIYRYRILHDFPGALQAYQEAQKRLPNNSDVFEQMAYVERRLGYWDAAETHYLAAIALDPRNLNILISMAYQFLSPLRRFAEAQAVLDRALQIAPEDESVFSTKALLFQADGQLDDAAKELGKVKANSDDESVVVARSLQFGYERRFDTAIAYLQPYTAASRPRETVGDTAKILLVWLGYCQEWAGRNGEARATFMRAVQAIKPSPDSVVPIGAQQLSCELALAYAGLGEKEKALDQARRAVVDYQDDAYAKPFAEQVLAEIEARFGDIDAAIAIIPKLLEVPSGITVGSLRVDPSWDPLRKDPRFQKLVAWPAPKAAEK